MATVQPISGSPINNNGGKMLHAGNVSSDSPLSNLSLTTNNHIHEYGSRVIQPSDPNSSGNVGGLKVLSGGVFGKMEEGKYVGLKLGDAGSRIAQTDNTTLKSGAADFGFRRPIHTWQGYQRLDITSWDYVTGAATVGAANGTSVLPSGIDGVTGQFADVSANPTDAVPGEFVHMVTGALATREDYKPRTG